MKHCLVKSLKQQWKGIYIYIYIIYIYVYMYIYICMYFLRNIYIRNIYIYKLCIYIYIYISCMLVRFLGWQNFSSACQTSEKIHIRTIKSFTIFFIIKSVVKNSSLWPYFSFLFWKYYFVSNRNFALPLSSC